MNGASRRYTTVWWFVIAALACCCSCAAIPMNKGGSSVSQDTYSIFFDYDPVFSLGVKINGVCYEGHAVLSPTEWGKEKPERFDPRLSGTEEDTRFSAERIVGLEFVRCKAPIPPELLDVLSRSHSFVLRTQHRQTEFSLLGETNPIHCAEKIDALANLNACENLLPSLEEVPHACDDQGANRWLAAGREKWGQFDACYDNLNLAALERLGNRPHLADVVCPRIVSKTSDGGVSDDILIKLLDTCYGYMEIGVRELARTAIYRRDVDRDYRDAREGDFRSMYTFYYKYRSFKPDLTESIRLSAASKFGPPDLDRWRRLRKDLESISIGNNRFTVCDVRGSVVQVSVNAFQIVRGTVKTGKELRPTLSEQIAVKKIVKKHGYDSARIDRECSRKANYWFFDEEH
jgi:hypothetical protein